MSNLLNWLKYKFRAEKRGAKRISAFRYLARR